MTTELSYRKLAVHGASPIGLMIVLFDTLAGDLRRAADALRKNDIEARCKELNHAALVLGQLESWLDWEKGGEAARSLATFYARLRARMMEASIKKSAAILDTQIEMLLGVRSAWQLLDTPVPETSEKQAIASMDHSRAEYAAPIMEMPDRVRFSQSA